MASNRNKSYGTRKENEVAAYLGLVRTGATGTQIYDLRDAHNSYYNLLKVEVKSGKQIPALVLKAFGQIRDHLVGNQIGAVVMVPPNVGTEKLPDEALVILKLKDFKYLLTSALSGISDIKSVTVEFKDGRRMKVDK